MRFLITLILLCLIVPAVAPAQSEPEALPEFNVPPKNVRFDRFDEGTTGAILQDRHGFMWLGGLFSGLQRYDGYTSKRFVTDPDDPNSLSSNLIRALVESRDGTLWVGTEEGLDRYDPVTESFTHIRHDPDDPNSLSSNLITSVLEDQAGYLWVGTGIISHIEQGRGLNRYDPETGSVTRYQHNPDDPSSLSADWVGALLQDSRGRLWIGTSNGLNLYHDGRFTNYRIDPDNPNANWIRRIYEDHRGRLWVGSDLLYLFDPETGRFTAFNFGDFDSDSTIPVLDGVTAIVEDPQGGLWVGRGGGGLIWFDPETGASTTFRYDPLDNSSLSGNAVVSLYVDRQEVLWAGSIFRSMNRLDRAAQSFDHIYPQPGEPKSLRLVNYGVMTIYEGPDGILWVSSFDVLNQVDRENGIVQHYQHDPGEPNSMVDSWTVLVDRSGTLWTGYSVLSRMDPDRPGRFTHFRHDPDDEQSLGPGNVVALYEDRQGILWIGHEDGGLSRLDDPEQGRFTRFPEGAYLAFNTIYEDSDGFLWLGTEMGGLVRFDPDEGTYKSYARDPDDPESISADSIFGVCERPQEPGILWVGAYNGGLNRFDKRTEIFRHYTLQNSDLADNGAQGVLCDDQGQVWVATDAGLSRYDPDSDTFKNFDVDDGLQGTTFNSWAFHKSPYTGELFFGGGNGVNAFYPEAVQGNPNPPEVALTDLKLFGESVPVGKGSLLERPLFETEALTLRHNQNDVTFEYVGLHYSNPAENRYAYMLEGYEDTWRNAGTVRSAVFTNLDPGDYTFRVRAANSDGVWNEDGASIRMTVLPPWWRTTWAYFLYGLLLMAGIFAVDRFQRRRLIRKERERAHHALEQAHADLQEAHTHLRTTQAQLVQQEKMASLGELTAGIAHEIKNPLNFINNFAEMVGELADELDEEIGSTKDTSKGVKEILDDLKLSAGHILKHGRRADSIVSAMMQHASGGTGGRELTEVNALLEKFVNLAYHGKRAQVEGFTCEIERDFDEAVGEVELIPQDMGRVFLNLLSNAFDAVFARKQQKGEAFEPKIRVQTHRSENAIEIRVVDNGPGIPMDLLPKIFEPFFTTKPTGSGTGLGLSLSYDIVTQGHGGTLEVKSTEDEGATFTITLPC